jgi:hypothetical protein
MAVTRVTYCSREDVKTALDIKLTARQDALVDAACEAATDTIEGELHRVFYPTILTRYWDWPNFQYAYPWRLWLDQWELADLPTSVTTGGEAIPLEACYFEPVNSAPPYTYLELRRDLPYGFGVGPTPQRDVAITGPFGYWTKTAPAGQLAAAIGDATSTAVTVSNAAPVGVGNVLVVDTERMLIADRAMVATGQTQQGPGASTDKASDVALQVADGTQIHVGEVLQLDAERMLAVDVTGNVVTVKRAWDGTVLATHAAATVYASRLLTVVRGGYGTTAAAHASGAAAAAGLIPAGVRNYATALAVVDVVQKTGGYTTIQGSGPGSIVKIGAGLPQLADAAYTRYGRKSRTRTI